MSRNRMKNSQSLHWMGVMKWILIVGLMSVLGLSYMLCKNQNMHMAAEASNLQKQLNAIQNRNAALAFDLEKMKSQRELERRLVQMHSTLVRLDDMRLTVVRMDQSTRMRLARIGTEPNHAINLNAPVATADATPAQP
jgi:hypothetical protein